MPGRHNFGNISYKPNKQNPTRIVASFPTPLEAFGRYVGLPQRQSKTFAVHQVAEARAWLNTSKRLIDAGVWEPDIVVETRKRAQTLTLGEYWNTYLKERRTKSGQPLTAQSRYRIMCDYDNHIAPRFAHIPITRIDQRMIDTWLDSLPQDQTSMRANSLKLLLSILRAATRPGNHGEPPILDHMPYTRPIRHVARKTATTPATPEQLRDIYRNMPAEYALAVYLTVFCGGLRISEVCALQRQDIDLDTQTLHVRRARQYLGDNPVGKTKTEHSVRDEPIPDSLMPFIRRHLDTLADQTPEAWLFPASRDPSKPVHQNSLRSIYSQARKAAGRPDLRFHDLRHTSLTWQAQDGATIRELMAAAGHTTTENAIRYQHATSPRRQQIAKKLADRLILADDHDLIRMRIDDIDRQIQTLQHQKSLLTDQLNKIREEA